MRHLIHRFAVAAIALSAALAASSPAFAGAIAHWTFDDPIGDRKIFQDTVGNGHPATPEKPDAVSAYPGDAPFGKSVALSGTYFNTPAIPLMSKGSFTVSVWFNLTKGDVPNPILADWPKGEIAYYLGTDITTRDKKPFLTADLRSGVETINAAKKKQYQPVARSQPPKVNVSLNEWHHVAWVWEKKDAQHGTLTTYLDGNVVDTATAAPSGFTTDIRANNKNIRIGGRADSTATFNGALDELWVFNEVLSADQIKNLMTTNSTLGGGSMAKVLVNKKPAAPAVAVAKPDPKPAPAPRAETPAPAAVTPATPAAVAVAPTPTPAPAAETPSTPAAPVTPAPTVVAAADNTPDVDPGLVVEIPAAVSPSMSALALTNTHAFTPLRIAGIATTSGFAAVLAAYLIWAVGERSKMRSSR